MHRFVDDIESCLLSDEEYSDLPEHRDYRRRTLNIHFQIKAKDEDIDVRGDWPNYKHIEKSHSNSLPE